MSVSETSGVPVAYTDGITIQFTLSSGTARQKRTQLYDLFTDLIHIIQLLDACTTHLNKAAMA